MLPTVVTMAEIPLRPGDVAPVTHDRVVHLATYELIRDPGHDPRAVCGAPLEQGDAVVPQEPTCEACADMSVGWPRR